MSQKEPKKDTHSHRMESEHPLAQKLVRKAEWAFEDEEFKEANRLLTQALAYDPDYDYAKINLARAYTEQNQPQQSIALLQPLLEHYPNEVELFNEYALALAKNNQTQEAIKLFEQLIEMNRTYPSSYANLGLIWEQNEQFEKALDIYQQYLQWADLSYSEEREEIEAAIQMLERKKKRIERRKKRKQK